jgi:hypothetical protein
MQIAVTDRILFILSGISSYSIFLSFFYYFFIKSYALLGLQLILYLNIMFKKILNINKS